MSLTQIIEIGVHLYTLDVQDYKKGYCFPILHEGQTEQKLGEAQPFQENQCSSTTTKP